MDASKLVDIAGPITGVERYCEPFEQAQIELPERNIGNSYLDYMERLCRLMAEHVPQEEAQSDGHDGMA